MTLLHLLKRIKSTKADLRLLTVILNKTCSLNAAGIGDRYSKLINSMYTKIDYLYKLELVVNESFNGGIISIGDNKVSVRSILYIIKALEYKLEIIDSLIELAPKEVDVFALLDTRKSLNDELITLNDSFYGFLSTTTCKI